MLNFPVGKHHYHANSAKCGLQVDTELGQTGLGRHGNLIALRE